MKMGQTLSWRNKWMEILVWGWQEIVRKQFSCLMAMVQLWDAPLLDPQSLRRVGVQVRAGTSAVRMLSGNRRKWQIGNVAGESHPWEISGLFYIYIHVYIKIAAVCMPSLRECKSHISSDQVPIYIFLTMTRSRHLDKCLKQGNACRDTAQNILKPCMFSVNLQPRYSGENNCNYPIPSLNFYPLSVPSTRFDIRDCLNDGWYSPALHWFLGWL